LIKSDWSKAQAYARFLWRHNQEKSQMRGIVLLAAFSWAIGATLSFADTVVVTPSNMGNWSLFTTDNANYGTPGGGSGTGTAQINSNQPDPNIVPAAGSVQLATGANHGDESAQLRDAGDWVGTKLSALTTLSYDTYATASNETPPAVSQDTFFILYVSNGDRLVFEPIYSDGHDVTNPNGAQATPALNTWQSWNLLKGMWYSDNFGGPGDQALSWTQILADEGANATIADDTSHGLGGIRFTVGEGSATDNFNVFVDNFAIGTAAGTSTYDFEPSAAAPLPATAWTSLGLLGGLAAFGASKQLRKRIA
jgi:hypothetical protein